MLNLTVLFPSEINQNTSVNLQYLYNIYHKFKKQIAAAGGDESPSLLRQRLRRL